MVRGTGPREGTIHEHGRVVHQLCRGQAANTGSDAVDTGNDGCGANAFGLATDIDTAGTVKAAITTTTEGTTENTECSNRGLCDYATGQCKCFTGYTDPDCSVQNALALR